MTRMIVLAGAPDSTQLDWSEKALLPVQHWEKTMLPATTTFLSKPDTPRWRRVEMDKLKMRPVLPKLNIDSPATEVDRTSPADFFSAAEFVSQDLAAQSAGSDVSADDSRPSQDSGEAESEALSEFYDHSFAIHEAIPSSQLTDPSQYTPGTPTYESSEEMFPPTPSMPGGIIRSPSQRRLSQAPRPKNLTELQDIPGANYLNSIQPQTMTVNLIVGILSIAPARVVTTGAAYGRARERELVEMTVGDDTKTGFSITMWLPREMRVNWKDGVQEKPEGARSNLRRSLKTLRPRDVVLIQNVALSSFRGKVHGQSLRGDVTKLDLLFRKKIGEDDWAGVYNVQNLRMATGKDAQIMKVKRVRDWLVDFVGEGPGNGRRRLDRGNEYRGHHRMLPEDTQ